MSETYREYVTHVFVVHVRTYNVCMYVTVVHEIHVHGRMHHNYSQIHLCTCNYFPGLRPSLSSYDDPPPIPFCSSKPYFMYMYMYVCCIYYDLSFTCIVLARVQVSLSDTVVQVNYRTVDQAYDYFLKLRVQRLASRVYVPPSKTLVLPCHNTVWQEIIIIIRYLHEVQI